MQYPHRFMLRPWTGRFIRTAFVLSVQYNNTALKEQKQFDFVYFDRGEDGTVASLRYSSLIMMFQTNKCAGHRNALGQGAYSTLPCSFIYKRAEYNSWLLLWPRRIELIDNRAKVTSLATARRDL